MGDEYEEECWVTESIGGIRARKIDFLITGVELARGCVSALNDALESTVNLLCQHANHMTDQAEFEDQARRQIETLTQEE